MPGGWTMSMAWMVMPGQTWAGAAAAFVGMWAVMMVAMMSPSVAGPLRRYRQALRAAGAPRSATLVALAAAGYFAVWIVLGALVFPLGAAIAAAAMRSAALARAVPVAASIVIVITGALQLSRWKARRLACCRNAFAGSPAPHASAREAWRQGVRLGAECVACCCGLTMMLLVTGVMDLRAMLAATAAITLERLLPRGDLVARIIGGALIAAGLLRMFA